MTTSAFNAEPDADQIAAVASGCSLVAGMHGGRFGEAATYLPRRRVVGVRVTPTELDVHVGGRYPATVAEVDSQLRAALAPYRGDLPLSITIEDYAPPQSYLAVQPAPGLPAPVHLKEQS